MIKVNCFANFSNWNKLKRVFAKNVEYVRTLFFVSENFMEQKLLWIYFLRNKKEYFCQKFHSKLCFAFCTVCSVVLFSVLYSVLCCGCIVLCCTVCSAKLWAAICKLWCNGCCLQYTALQWRAKISRKT